MNSKNKEVRDIRLKNQNNSTLEKKFDLNHTIHQLKRFLPSQTSLKDFIHHNSLHAYQQMKFYDAIFKASKIFGYQVTLQLHEFRTLFKDERIRADILHRAIRERKPIDSLDDWKKKLTHQFYDVSNKARIGQLRNEWSKTYQIDLSFNLQPLLFRMLNSYLDQGIALNAFPLVVGGFLASVRELERNGFSSFFNTKRASDLLLNEIGRAHV